VPLFDACNGVTASLPVSGYFTTAGFARADAAALHGFQAALRDATAGTGQPGPLQAVLHTLPGMSARQAALVTMGQYPAFLSAGQVQRVADLMYGTGMITTTITVRNLLFR
jgi:NitT/TauT family transport system substrate-binding protein